MATASLTKVAKANASQTNLTLRDKEFQDENRSSKNEEDHPLVWKLLDSDQIEKLRYVTPPEMEMMLAKMLDFQDFTVCLIEGAKLDYFVSGFLFGIEEKFDNYQLSCFMSLLDKVLNNCQSNMDLKTNINDFTKYFIGINSEESYVTSGMERFDVDQSKKIINYMSQGIFQHYKLYENLFFGKQEEVNIENQIEVQLLPSADTPFPAPLLEGLPFDLYEKYIAPPPPSDSDSVEVEHPAEDAMEKSPSNVIENTAPGSPCEKEGVADLIMKNLKPEEIKKIVTQVTDEALRSVKTEAEAKIKERENVMISKINRLHLSNV